MQETWHSLNIPAKYDNTTVLSPVQTTEILKLGHMLGLYPTWWERLPLAPTGVMRRRVDRALQEIDMDDFAIARDGGPEGLEAEEVRMAAETRGMDILGRDEGTVRGDLEWWIRKREGLSVVDLLREKVEGNEKRS